MKSSLDLPVAMETQRQLAEMCSSAGFPLRKWKSNSKEFLESIPESIREKKPSFLTLLLIRPLKLSASAGIQNMTILNSNTKMKSNRLKQNVQYSPQIAKYIDPMGELGPVVIHAKIMMQLL